MAQNFIEYPITIRLMDINFEPFVRQILHTHSFGLFYKNKLSCNERSFYGQENRIFFKRKRILHFFWYRFCPNELIIRALENYFKTCRKLKFRYFR